MASWWREWSTVWPRRLRAAVTSRGATLLLSVALVLSTTGVVLADDGEGGPPDAAPPRPGANKLPPGGNPEVARKAYMTLLFQEINVRRDRAGTPRYAYMADAGSEAIDAYLSDLLPAMVSTIC